MTEKTCNSCIHFEACSKWTDFPKQCGVPVCASFAQQSEKYLMKENGDILPLTHHSEWISVTERLPESGASVLGYSEIVGDIRCYDICKGRCDSTLQWWSETGWATVDDLLVTHWMPLPSAPKGE